MAKFAVQSFLLLASLLIAGCSQKPEPENSVAASVSKYE